jgi:hypothetical protein
MACSTSFALRLLVRIGNTLDRKVRTARLSRPRCFCHSRQAAREPVCSQPRPDQKLRLRNRADRLLRPALAAVLPSHHLRPAPLVRLLATAGGVISVALTLVAETLGRASARRATESVGTRTAYEAGRRNAVPDLPACAQCPGGTDTTKFRNIQYASAVTAVWGGSRCATMVSKRAIPTPLGLAFS